MRVVIDIPDSYYSACKEWQTMGVATVDQCIIANGTPYEERPKGKWELFVERPFYNVYKCSNCGVLIESTPDGLTENFKGCYCGADMRGDVCD